MRWKRTRYGWTAGNESSESLNYWRFWLNGYKASFFTQPPSGRRRMRICFAVVFFSFLFSVFIPSTKTMRQPFSGTAERIFMKLSPNDRGGNVVWNVVPPLGESRAAAWRMANVDDLRNLRYDSFAITRGRHARRLRYTTLSARMDVI